MTAPSLGAGSAGDVEGLAERIWAMDDYDLNADPDSRTARELRPIYERRAKLLLASDWLAAHVASASTADRERVARVEALAEEWRAQIVAQRGGPDATRTRQIRAVRPIMLDELRAALAAPPVEREGGA